MNGNELKNISDIFMEEQEWVPGYSAPFVLWVTMAGAGAYLILSTAWLIHHNNSGAK